MISPAIRVVASRMGVSVTVPELESDIDAQIKALLDPDHPKMAVFLARGNNLGARQLPKWIFVERRPEGTLLTDCAEIATTFRNIEWITDDFLAALLGYPEPKGDLILRDDVCVVQALDENGAVIFEAGASAERLTETVAAAEAQVPRGGSRAIISPAAALARRHQRMN